MSHRPGDTATLRVEYRPPDGEPRLLAESTVWSVAGRSVRTWRRRLRRERQAGAVVVVAARTGAVLATYPLDVDPDAP